MGLRATGSSDWGESDREPSSNGGQPIHTTGDKQMGWRGGQNFLGPIGESGHLADGYWTSAYEN